MAEKRGMSKFLQVLLFAAAPLLLAGALAIILIPTRQEVSALYVVSDDAYVPVDNLTADIFLTDAYAELVSRQSGNDLRLNEGLAVTIVYGGQSTTTMSRRETVSSLLTRMRITPSPLEMVSVAFDGGTVRIEIASEFIFYESEATVTEHEVLYQECAYRPSWYEAVLQEGSDGIHSKTYEVVYQDGEVVSRHLIDETDTQPVPTIIEKGVLDNFANNDDPVASIVTNEDGSGVITLENGETVTFSEVRTMRGTAYTAGEPGVDFVTATGTTVRSGTVAIDRRQLPLGSKLYVVSADGIYSYGFSIAEDTGVRGNSIDLYMHTYDDCIQFGRRDCTVYILD